MASNKRPPPSHRLLRPQKHTLALSSHPPRLSAAVDSDATGDQSWDRIYPDAVEMYRNRGFKLREFMTLMEHRHGFKAT